jgi:hypothetical protein
MIIVQANIDTGNHAKQWFAFDDKGYYSKPLSDIEPDGKQSAYVPACVVFTFDANYLIFTLAIYMDRWQMAADLWPRTAPHGKKLSARFLAFSS